MKLIDEAINLLGDANAPLANAFFKAQIIAHKLKAKEFAEWVKNEIQGYGEDVQVPEYRQVRLTPYGNVQSMTLRYNNHQLPTGGMPSDLQDRFLVSHLNQSIAVIEEFSKSDDGLIVPLNADLHGFLRKGFTDGFLITSAWGKPPAGCFTQILHEARSRLLSLLLELSDVVPDSDDAGDQLGLPDVNEVNGLFKNVVFGDGANISLAIGQGSQASYNTTSVVKNDLESLVEELAANKVSETDIAELKAAMKEDSDKPSQSKGIGSSVRAWIGSMVSKSGTPAWEVPFQVAAGILTNAISKFYGIS
ncbi:hypothetical protein [Pseudomonas sp. NPDC089534]|uniref:AbiTii domain-containing protein n=1 Tax=Pseudomonas sp. NPDC089534 TaxID=3364468 RepID=UPI00381FCC60